MTFMYNTALAVLALPTSVSAIPVPLLPAGRPYLPEGMSHADDEAVHSALLSAGEQATGEQATFTVPSPQFVAQEQDHFDGTNMNQWNQAYFVNDTFWVPGSDAPIFLCVGGEGPPLTGASVVASVHCSVASQWLAETKALMFGVEHRYYGCHNASACPVDEMKTTADLKFLSSRQALGGE